MSTRLVDILVVAICMIRITDSAYLSWNCIEWGKFEKNTRFGKCTEPKTRLRVHVRVCNTEMDRPHLNSHWCVLCECCCTVYGHNFVVRRLLGHGRCDEELFYVHSSSLAQINIRDIRAALWNNRCIQASWWRGTQWVLADEGRMGCIQVCNEGKATTVWHVCV